MKTAEQYLIDNKLNDLVISKSTTNGRYTYTSEAMQSYAEQFMPKWIECKSQLPPFNTKVATLFAGDCEGVHELVKGEYGIPPYPNHWYSIYDNETHFLDVTHWMPLPQKP